MKKGDEREGRLRGCRKTLIAREGFKGIEESSRKSDTRGHFWKVIGEIIRWRCCQLSNLIILVFLNKKLFFVFKFRSKMK